MYSTADPSAGLENAQVAASFAFYLLAMAFLSLMFAICCLRTNVCLAIVEWGLTITFSLLTGTFWNLAQGNAAVARKYLIVSISPVFYDDYCGLTRDFRLPVRLASSLLLLAGGSCSH